MLGSILGGLFGSDKTQQNFYSPGVNSNLNWLTGQFKGDNATISNALAAFNAENAARIADTNQIGRAHV